MIAGTNWVVSTRKTTSERWTTTTEGPRTTSIGWSWTDWTNSTPVAVQWCANVTSPTSKTRRAVRKPFTKSYAPDTNENRCDRFRFEISKKTANDESTSEAIRNAMGIHLSMLFEVTSFVYKLNSILGSKFITEISHLHMVFMLTYLLPMKYCTSNRWKKAPSTNDIHFWNSGCDFFVQFFWHEWRSHFMHWNHSKGCFSVSAIPAF